MNRTSMTVGKGAKGPSTLVRARFGPGMLLQHDDLELLTTYPRELSRLLFRSLFGCGVVCGLKVSTNTKDGMVTITVGAGVALACSGDPIYVPNDRSFALVEECDTEPVGPLWVVLCGTVKSCAPRTSVCPSDEDDTPPVWTREQDGYEIHVLNKAPECACGCLERQTKLSQVEPSGEQPDVEGECRCARADQPCYRDHYEGKCGCRCEECSDCDCKRVLLARLDRRGDTDEWIVDHRVRRFVRPVLMRDPVVEAEERARREKKAGDAAALEELTEVETVHPASVKTSAAGEARQRQGAGRRPRGSPRAGR